MIPRSLARLRAAAIDVARHGLALFVINDNGRASASHVETHETAFTHADRDLQRAAFDFVIDRIQANPGSIGYAGDTLDNILVKIRELAP